MTYSCAVWPSPDVALEAAQAAKYELDLPQARAAARHAAARRRLRVGRHGRCTRRSTTACGPSASRSRSARPSSRRSASREAGLERPGRDPRAGLPRRHDGPFDAISSIGMFEHVGLAQARRVLRPAVRAARARRAGCSTTGSAGPRRRAARRGRGSSSSRSSTGTCSPTASCTRSVRSSPRCSGAGFEARHVESLREHYALTLRAWVRNLEADWDRAVAIVGRRAGPASGASTWPRPRSTSRTAATRSTRCSRCKPNGGASGMPLRPSFSERPVRDVTLIDA